MDPPHLCHRTLFPCMKVYTRAQRQKESACVNTLQKCTVGITNGVTGSLSTDLLPISVHTRKITHSMAESAQAARRENKER